MTNRIVLLSSSDETGDSRTSEDGKKSRKVSGVQHDRARLTIRLTDPAPLVSEFQARRNRKVRWSRLLRQYNSHLAYRTK
jgi:hypothetical protein